MTPQKIPVGVLGATGTVGQRFVERLSSHPWFELAAVAASDRSAGKSYSDAARWRLSTPLPDRVASMNLRSVAEDLPCRIVFSALDAGVAREVESACARQGKFVFSNASAFRMEPDVPLLIPEINADSLSMIPRQQRLQGWKGAIVTNANCSVTVLALAVAPLHRAFSVRRAFVTTMQAVSGAGYPGVPSLDILGNVIPDIPEEAPKIERELLKILGSTGEDSILPAPIAVSAMTYRVPVEDGHTLAVSVELERRASPEEVARAWQEFRGPEGVRGLPSAPAAPILYSGALHRPQPRRDVDTGGGMVTIVGSLKPCTLLDWKFTALGHNTVRGAAGGSILNAECAAAKGLLD
ncbi:MAG TPA: aspartate-semialdehyde dehydrogenase [Thermoanaerobaculia bacterium]